MENKTFSTEIGGKTLKAEFTDLADQANGSVIIRYGNTVILATAAMSDGERDGIDYFPLTVDYEEKFYAAGQILGSRFMRREGRPSDEAVLSGRVVDRTIRPLFNQQTRREVQVIITILSIDEDDPDVLAVLGASLALGTSSIPWNGPVSAVRIGKHNGDSDFIINPTYTDRESGELSLDLMVCGRNGTINMIEVGSDEVSEEMLGDAFKQALTDLKKLEEFQKDIISQIGKEKEVLNEEITPDELVELFKKNIAEKLPSAVFSGSAGKKTIGALKKEWIDSVQEELPDISRGAADRYYESRVNDTLHEGALKENKRADGRKLNEIRSLFAQAGGMSPVLHGSGTFYRGGTHVFSALTLGGPNDSLIIDTIEEQEVKKHFMHHYNFPPFSVGETGRVGGFNRRMIGHGALAEKALKPVIPTKEVFPYTIRVVSESMASNGSTSMASVCASTVALMDGGVPIKNPVAGIAMGLMLNEEKAASGNVEGEYKILTDIQGPEDHHGDMDFKVAGTRDGVTAVQMDVKISGVPLPILIEAFEEAKRARITILDRIEEEIKTPRESISPHAPKIVTTTIKPDQIGMVIGPGGKVVNKIREDTGTEIEIDDDGTIFITGKGDGPDRAKETISEMTREYVSGDKFEGEVTRIMNFGAFVKIGHNTEGLVHVSEIAPFRVESVEEVLKTGEAVPVVVKEIDDQGRINLSIKAVDPDFLTKKGIKPKTNNDKTNS
tara:strand:- start:12193 stop:14367 length:2175 start_codon:yes stop_codon:yes gene_type:complete